MEFSADCSSRPPLQFIISKKTWQVTSLKAMVQMSPECTCVSADSLPVAACSHGEFRTEQESHFAPTGKGTVTMRLFCTLCNKKVSENTEVYD
jgi:hypothetical protein